MNPIARERREFNDLLLKREKLLKMRGNLVGADALAQFRRTILRYWHKGTPTIQA